MNKDGSELRLDGAKKLVQDATASLTVWEIWVPEEQKASLDGRVKGLKMLNHNPEARRAEFLIAQRVAEEERGERVPEVPARWMDAKGTSIDGGETERVCKGRGSPLAQLKQRRSSSWTVLKRI